jgi:hypothetical protein
MDNAAHTTGSRLQKGLLGRREHEVHPTASSDAQGGASVNRLAAGTNWQLLDVGRGPATLGLLSDPNVQYFGIDIAIQEPSPNLTECHILQEPIGFEEKQFVNVAQGLLEYLVDSPSRKSRRSPTSLRHMASSLPAT